MQPRSAPIDELAGVSESLGSAIGSTSLMGLLGGTRYEPASEDKLASDDAELEGLGGDKLMGLGSYARPHQRDSIGPMSLYVMYYIVSGFAGLDTDSQARLQYRVTQAGSELAPTSFCHVPVQLDTAL